MSVSLGQLQYEWAHLRAKLPTSQPSEVARQDGSTSGLPDAHPLFKLRKGGVESWERI